MRLSAETLNVLDFYNIAPYEYERAMASSATHEEILRASKLKLPLENYTYARLAGATHREVLEASRAGIGVLGYYEARQEGEIHSHIVKRMAP